MTYGGPGFPDPLFKDIEGLDGLAEDAFDVGAPNLIPYLLNKAPIGPLRMADPFLGDLTVMAREAVAKVEARIAEIRDPTLQGAGGLPPF